MGEGTYFSSHQPSDTGAMPPKIQPDSASAASCARHSLFLLFLFFIDSRKRKLSLFISKMWQRCVSRSSKAAVIRSPWKICAQSPNGRLLVINKLRRS